MIKNMDMEKYAGQMVVSMLASGLLGNSMGPDNILIQEEK